MRRSTRIALISEHASPAALVGGQDAGGQNVYVDELSRNLAELGYNVDVFSRRDNPELPRIIDWAPGVRVIHLDAGPLEYISKDALWPYMPALKNELLRFMMRDGGRYELLHGNFWMSGWVAVELADRLGVPAVQTFHALGTTKRRHQGPDDTSPPERIPVEQDIVRRMTRIIAQCPNERARLMRDYDAPRERISLRPAGVNTDRFRPVDRRAARRRIRLDDDGPIIVYVGRLLPRKDIRNVVRALSTLTRRIDSGDSPLDTPPQLLIVGGESAEPDPKLTPEIGEVQRLAAELDVGNQITFTGRKDHDELRYFYGASDVAVTTPWYEPFGLTPLEAMACGRPVIGSGVGGLTFTIDDCRTGFLVPPRDPDSLAARMEHLLSDPGLKNWMGQQARSRVERNFTWPVVTRKIATTYERVIAESQFRRWAPATRISGDIGLWADDRLEGALGED